MPVEPMKSVSVPTAPPRPMSSFTTAPQALNQLSSAPLPPNSPSHTQTTTPMPKNDAPQYTMPSTDHLTTRELDRLVHLHSLHNFAECFRLGLGLSRDLKKAVFFHQKAIDEDYAPSMYRLGQIYDCGHEHVPQDSKRAFRLYATALRFGFVQARTALAECYRHGRGIGKNASHAIGLLKESVDKKEDPEAFVILGDCLRDGIAVTKDPCGAFELYRRAVASKVVIAQTRIAECLFQGVGAPKNVVTAFKWYQSAAASGEHTAFFPLAKCYAQGIGVSASRTEAFRWFQRSADDAKNPHAMLIVAECFHAGQGVERSIDSATRYWALAAEQGIPKAKVALAECYLEGISLKVDTKLAVELLQSAHEAGEVMASVSLGECYLDGIGVERESGKGIYLLVQAAGKLCVHACLVLASRYLKGNGVNQSYDLAMSNFEKATHLGSGEAHFALGQMYLRDVGVPIDTSKALHHLKTAFDAGCCEAATLLARCYKYHIGVPKADLPLAFAILSRAADQGNVSARRELALCYMKGDGCPQNFEKARTVLSQLCDSADGVAARYLGELYLDGASIGRDVGKAVDLFKKGRVAGDGVAIRRLALCYRDSIGVERDLKRASVLFGQAVDAGDVGSLGFLARCFEEGTGVECDFEKAVILYERAVKAGRKELLMPLLKCYAKVDSQDDDVVAKREFAVLSRLYQDGNVNVGMRLAWLYFKGFGVPKDVHKAVSMLEKELERGVSCSILVLLARCLSGDDFGQEGKTRALRYLKRASELGFAEGKVMLARLLMKDDSDAKRDEQQGIRLLEEASLKNASANIGTIESKRKPCTASVMLGELYSRGVLKVNDVCYARGEVDEAQGAAFYEKGVKSGYGCYRLAKCYLKGRGVQKNTQRGLQLLRQAVKKKCAHAQLLMCRYFENGRDGVPVDLREALRLYQGATHRLKGRARGRAFYRYGAFLRAHGTTIGRFASQSMAENFVADTFENARRAGCRYASNDLAVLIVHKSTVTADDCVAVVGTRDRPEDVDREVATNGSGAGGGDGQEEHENDTTGTAFQMFLELGRGGLSRGVTNTGICLEQGIGVMQDVKAAKRHYEDGVIGGDRVAENNLAVILLEEADTDDVEDRRDRAVKLLKISLGKGEVRAVVNLAKVYENGLRGVEQGAGVSGGEVDALDVEQGKKRSFSMYQEAASEGCAEAAFNLAACYEAQIGTEYNEQLASKHYKVASEGNVEAATQRLKRYQT